MLSGKSGKGKVILSSETNVCITCYWMIGGYGCSNSSCPVCQASKAGGCSDWEHLPHSQHPPFLCQCRPHQLWGSVCLFLSFNIFPLSKLSPSSAALPQTLQKRLFLLWEGQVDPDFSTGWCMDTGLQSFPLAPESADKGLRLPK